MLRRTKSTLKDRGLIVAASAGCASIARVRISRVATGCSRFGISLRTGDSDPAINTVERCVVRHASLYGIRAETVR